MKYKNGIINALKKATKYIEDILILGGLICIITATFLWSKIAGVYVLGGCLFGLGIFFVKFPHGKG